MRRKQMNVVALGALLAVPAVALGGGSTTYSGEGTTEPQAKIELKITNGDERKVTKVTVREAAV